MKTLSLRFKDHSQNEKWGVEKVSELHSTSIFVVAFGLWSNLCIVVASLKFQVITFSFATELNMLIPLLMNLILVLI